MSFLNKKKVLIPTLVAGFLFVAVSFQNDFFALAKQIEEAKTLTALEDIYLPYKPKRKTRASVAKEKGLEPLALRIFAQSKIDPEQEAAAYINDTKGVANQEEALAGARDIIAEMVSENAEARTKMRHHFMQKATYKTVLVKGKDEAGIKYKDYFEWEESAKSAPSHRVLAMLRGEQEGFLKLNVLPPDEPAVELLERQYIREALDQAGGNRSEAAKLLGITRQLLYSKLEKYQLQ
mgnify:CR=1 FL=1